VTDAAANQRRTVYYSGHVQGVGFRYTTRTKAQQYEVTGYVENLDDGRVLVVVEGRPEEIERFLANLGETMQQFIRRADVSQSPATGEFRLFEIRH
jgi:acylphosphatase